MAFTALFSYSIFLTYIVAYVAEVFSSSLVGLPWSEGCTHGFFTSGSAGFPSSCCAASVLALFALSLGSSLTRV
jgi:hypothetical protein